MIEKLICAVIIAVLWLYSFGALSGAVQSAKEIVNAYKLFIRTIEQEKDE